MGNQFLKDIENTIWASEDTSLYVSLATQPQVRDPFTRLVHGTLLDIYDRIWGRRRKVGCSAFTFVDLEHSNFDRLPKATRWAREFESIESRDY